MLIKQTVFKSGGSYVVSIPSSFVEIVGVKSGDKVSVKTQYERGRIIYTFSGAQQLVLPSSAAKKQKIKK